MNADDREWLRGRQSLEWLNSLSALKPALHWLWGGDCSVSFCIECWWDFKVFILV